ncbi:MAG: transposase [Pseudomonadota bacterium]
MEAAVAGVSHCADRVGGGAAAVREGKGRLAVMPGRRSRGPGRRGRQRSEPRSPTAGRRGTGLFLAPVAGRRGACGSSRASVKWSTKAGTQAERCRSCGYGAWNGRDRRAAMSCGARRMSQTLAHLVDHVIPRVPVRQWVLSLPITLRVPSAAQPARTTPVLQVVQRVVTHHRLDDEGLGAAPDQGCAVTLVQRFGSAANLDIHLHDLVVDGVCRGEADGMPSCVEAAAPTDDELHALLQTVIAWLLKMPTRRGVLVEDMGQTWQAEPDADGEEARTLRPLQAAAITCRIAFGPCAGIDGFSLHAAVRTEAHDRQRLEQLCRQITRPVLADERVQVNAPGHVELKLKTPWRDGTTRLVMSPPEFMQRPAALEPRPKLRLIRFPGVLVQNAQRRPLVMPQQPPAQPQAVTEAAVAAECEAEPAQAPPHRISRARLPRRVFDVDMQHCPNWGCGELKIIAAILERPLVEQILT